MQFMAGAFFCPVESMLIQVVTRGNLAIFPSMTKKNNKKLLTENILTVKEYMDQQCRNMRLTNVTNIALQNTTFVRIE